MNDGCDTVDLSCIPLRGKGGFFRGKGRERWCLTRNDEADSGGRMGEMRRAA